MTAQSWVELGPKCPFVLRRDSALGLAVRHVGYRGVGVGPPPSAGPSRLRVLPAGSGWALVSGRPECPADGY